MSGPDGPWSGPATDPPEPSEVCLYDLLTDSSAEPPTVETFDSLISAEGHVARIIADATRGGLWTAEKIGRMSWLLTNASDGEDIVDLGIVERVVPVAEGEAGR